MQAQTTPAHDSNGGRFETLGKELETVRILDLTPWVP
jgi:hypothetical protein